jgi:hypothetical protein
MSYGFQATNDNNQVLVSSETKNLHFIQKLTGPRNTTVSISDPDAGILYSTNINGGIRRWRYTATCATTPVPFFTMPTNDYYGILRIVDKGNSRWDIEIFRSGTSTTVPELYIFSDPALPFTLTHTGSSAYEAAFTAAQQSNGQYVPLRAYPDSEHIIYKTTVSFGGYFGSYLDSARQGSIVPLQDFTAMTKLTGTVQGSYNTATEVYYTVSLPWNISFGTRDNINMFYISKCSAVTFDTPRLDVTNIHVPFSGWSTPNLDDCIMLSSHPRWIFDNTANTAEINKAGIWVTTTGTAPNRRFYIRARFHDSYALTASNNLPPALSWQIMLPEDDPGKQWIRFGQNQNYTWPENFPKAYIYEDTTKYGMVVYRDDGTPSFDSRLGPLVVNAAVTLTHPSIPRYVSAINNEPQAARSCWAVSADNAYMFQADQYNSYSMYTQAGASTNPAKPIFSFLSIAQSQRQLNTFNTQGYNDNFWGAEYNRDYFYSYYWQFYRGAITNPVSSSGLHTYSTDTIATVVGTPVHNFNTTTSIFYNGYGGNTTNWYNTGTRSGDDGLWLIALEWPIYFTNREGTGQVAYNVMLLSTNGYITFNYQNPDGSYRDPDAGSFVFSNLATASTLAAARIMVYAADNSARQMGITQFGTAPNRTNVIRYYGFPDTSSWSNAQSTPNLVWEIQFPENKPDEMYIVFPNGTINASAGAVLGVGTASGWQSIETRATGGSFTPNNLVIKKGRSVADYRASPVLQAGWGTHDFGCNYYFYNTGGGGVIGGLFGPGSNTNVGGTWPYTNETLNLASNTVIVADGSKYD